MTLEDPKHPQNKVHPILKLTFNISAEAPQIASDRCTFAGALTPLNPDIKYFVILC